MSGGEQQVIGHCGECGHAIPAGYLYGWCVQCSADLPGEVKAQVMPPEEEGQPGVRLRVKGRVVPCPVCQNERFRVRSASWPDAGWTGPLAETYICLDCGHALWFMR